MNNWLLIAVFSFLLLVALAIAFIPLRTHKRLILAVLPLLIILIMSAYWQWGGWSDWNAYTIEQDKQQQVQAMLKKLNSPQELIDKLKSKLSLKSESAQGWYLLGRLYTSQGNWSEANEAFKIAHELRPENTQFLINYAQSQWQLNNQLFNDTIRGLFRQALDKDANQPDALAMLAMDEFLSHHYQQAINHWQQLLKQMPPDSEDAQAIRRAIAKAQKQQS